MIYVLIVVVFVLILLPWEYWSQKRKERREFNERFGLFQNPHRGNAGAYISVFVVISILCLFLSPYLIIPNFLLLVYRLCSDA